MEKSPLRKLRLTGFVVAGALLGMLLAAWLVPRALDWGRYRAAIAAIASARIGRPVTIDGDIALSLLPEVVLTASKVTLADRGDGISAHIGALRLRVALPPLLQGRILPRDLALEDAMLRLPWPLPADIAAPASARLPKGFSARLEHGTLQLGTVLLPGLSATLRADADTGAFAANGVLAGKSESWVFTALLGSPGADGISTLNLTADGQGEAQNTGGYFRGRMEPSGAVDGRVFARGPDLSVLMAAPRISWQAGGKLSASDRQVQAPDIDLSIGASPGHAALTLSLRKPLGLVGTLAAGRIDLASWANAVANAPRPGLNLHLHIAAEAGALPGGAARNLRATLDADASQARLTEASATLPGDADMALNGDIVPGGIRGTFILTAPDPAATLRWLRPAAPRLIDALPRSGLAQAKLAGTLGLDRRGLSAENLSGTFAGTAVAGSAAIGFDAPRGFAADLRLDRIALDRIAPDVLPDAITMAQGTAQGEARIQANTVTWRGVALTDVKLDALAGPGGLVLKSLAFKEAGGHAEASGTLLADGSLTGLSLSAAAPDAGAVLASLPPAWRRLPLLWRGNFDLAATAAGRADALGTQLRVDIGDLRMEADGTLNLATPQAEATITLRHPGAPRLLHGLGFENAYEWLDTGSVALAAHIHAEPGHLSVHNFALSAAQLRIGGAGAADFTGDTPNIDATLHADSLTLPAPERQGALPFHVLSGWRGHVALTADALLLGLRPAATDIEAICTLAGGVLGAEPVKARIGTATLSAGLAIDGSAAQPVIALRGTMTGLTPDTLPGGLGGGEAGMDADLTATGASWPALLATATGEVRATLTSADLDDIDLAGLTRLLTARAAKLRPELQKSLTTGTTHFLSGTATATVAQGAATLGQATLSNAEGTITASGDIDLAEQTLDVRLGIFPAVPAPPAIGLRLVGPWGAPRRVADLAPALLWAGKTRQPAHGSTAGDSP